MKISQFLEEMNGMSDDELNHYALQVTRMFCGVSRASMQEFKNKWDYSRSGDEYNAELKRIFRQCVEIECSAIGQIVAKVAGGPGMNKEIVLIPWELAKVDAQWDL